MTLTVHELRLQYRQVTLSDTGGGTRVYTWLSSGLWPATNLTPLVSDLLVTSMPAYLTWPLSAVLSLMTLSFYLMF